MKRVSRPFMFTGLLISLFAFIGSLALCAFLVVTYMSIAASIGNEITNLVYFIVIGAYIIIMIFALLGLIFSAVSLSRCNLSPSEFYEKKGMVIATLVFNILVAVLYLISLFTAFNFVALIMLLVFVVSSVFIIVDLAKNKKLLAKEDEEKTQKTDEKAQIETTNETKSEE